MVSICIPAYEAPASLARLLNSILIQSYRDFEIIISDDTQGDSIYDLVQSYTDSRIRYHHNATPLGSPENWNYAVSLASGDFIKVMHHDDWFDSDYSLERMVLAMNEKGEDFLFVQSKNMGSDGLISVNAPTSEAVNAMVIHPFSLFFKNIIGAPSATLYRKCGYRYDHNLRWFVDVEFYYSMIADGASVSYLPEQLVCVGVDGPRVTNEYLNCFPSVAEEFFYSWYKFKKDGRLSIGDSYYWLYRFLKEYQSLRWRDFLPYMRAYTAPVSIVLWTALKFKMAFRRLK